VPLPLLMLVAYLVLGMGTTTALWTGNRDELDMAIGFEVDDEHDVGVFRLLLTVMFVLVWPVVFWDAFSKR